MLFSFVLVFYVLLIPDILDHPACWGESRRLFRRLWLSWPMGSGASVSERASAGEMVVFVGAHTLEALASDWKGAWLDT